VAFSSKIFNIGKSISGKITSVSSSIFKRRPLNTDTFLKPNTTPIEETLIETNSILSEIQKQLALDFAYRIAKEDDELKGLQKSSEERDSISKKLGVSSSPLGKVTNKVISPIKGIFQQIFQFLLWIGGGFLLNKILKDPKKFNIFDFKNWKKWGTNFINMISNIRIGNIRISKVISNVVKEMKNIVDNIKILFGLAKKIRNSKVGKGTGRVIGGFADWVLRDATDFDKRGIAGGTQTQELNKGGLVRGMGGVDNIPARLSAGEVVMSNDAADLWGRDNLLKMNMIGNKKQTYSKLGRPNKSLPITVLPSINSGSTDTGTVPDSPSDADSVPLVLSENTDNDYVGYMRSQLGIFE
tara:strand:+ start:320 stop:1384 length:1065 start_codon:yes stop_codon:yes gene_type:complete